MYIPVEAVKEVKERIDRYNQKWNTKVTCVLDEPCFQDKELADGTKVKVEVVWVELEAPQVKTAKDGVELLEIVSVKDGIDHVSFKGTEEYIPYRKDECDHCHSKRSRNLYYIIRYEGEIRQIGSSCVKEYLGESIYSVFSGFYKLLEEVETIREHFKGETYYEALDDIAKATFEETEGFSKWTPNRYGNGTSEGVKVSLSKGEYHKSRFSWTPEDKKDFAQHILYNKSGTNEMSLNIAWTCLDGNNTLREFIPFRSAGTCAWAIYEFYKAKREGKLEEEKKAINLTPICETVGVKVSFEANVVLLRKGTNDWGDFYEYMASDGEHCAAWYTSKKLEEGRAKVTGKVKGTWYKKEGFCTLFGGRVKVEPISNAR